MKPEKTPGKRSPKAGSTPTPEKSTPKTNRTKKAKAAAESAVEFQQEIMPLIPSAPVVSAKPAKKPAASRTRKSPAKAAPESPAKVEGSSLQVPATLQSESVAPKTKSSAKVPKNTASRLKIPPILLEGDTAPVPTMGGPGARYALSHETPSLVGTFGETGDLPQAYGTKRLFLTARDPHWLYASWDLTHEQIRELNKQASHGHLVIRVYENEIGGDPITEVHVHPESQNWFIHVPKSETRYVAALGYYDKNGKWQKVSASRKTFAPPDALAEDTSVQFATIAPDVSFRKLVETVKAVFTENMPLVEAFHRAAEQGEIKGISFPKPGKPWTPSQEARLSKLITMDDLRRVWIGSLEITELIRRRMQQDISSLAAAELARQAAIAGISSAAISSISSPFGGEGKKGKSFWFNINAELIIYGATEPDAKVTIGDKHIKLRPDGSFSFRFILPDGNYELPAIAVSNDGDDSREARLQFSRQSDYRGKVDKHPQDPAMRPPRPENVA